MLRFILLIVVVIFGSCVLAQEADVSKSNGIMYEGQMDYLKAAEAYARADKLYTEQGVIDTLSVFKAGQNYVRVKKYDIAMPYLERAEAYNYNDKNVYLTLADAYNGLNKDEAAEQSLLRGMARYPEEKESFSKKLAYHYFNSKSFEKAIQAINDALTYYPDDANLLYLKGSALERTQEYNEAIAVFESILATDPDNEKVVTKMGVLSFKLTDFQYEKEMKRYEGMKNPDRIDYSNSRKKLEQISKGYNTALPYLEKARGFNPDDKLVLNCLMVAYQRLNQTEKSEAIKAILQE